MYAHRSLIAQRVAQTLFDWHGNKDLVSTNQACLLSKEVKAKPRPGGQRQNGVEPRRVLKSTANVRKHGCD
jgi:hypothetical protein